MKKRSVADKPRKRFIPGNRKWLLNRKHFLAAVIAGTASLSFRPLRMGGRPEMPGGQGFGDEERELVGAVQEILFPSDGNGPGAADIQATEYLEWVLSDREKDPDEVSYILDGIGWVNEYTNKSIRNDFNDIGRSEQEYIITRISYEPWGESWLSVILTYIFEALLCDPQYPGNPENVGWQWLNHNPGMPRPDKDLLYPKILDTIRNRGEE